MAEDPWAWPCRAACCLEAAQGTRQMTCQGDHGQAARARPCRPCRAGSFPAVSSPDSHHSAATLTICICIYGALSVQGPCHHAIPEHLQGLAGW